MKQKPLIILTGPAAVGKSALSILLAKAVGGEIISADSMQVYRGMDIGTAKITKEEMDGVPHYLIDEIEPDEPFNVVVFQEMAKKAMERIYANGNIPIIAGGTGFYIQALLKNVEFAENDNDSSYRQELEKMAQNGEAELLYAMLEKEDPESAAAIHPNNIKKIIRALEFKKQTGQKISDHNRMQAEQLPPYNFAYFVLTLPRQELYHRIEKRVDLMLREGLTEEVEALRRKGYSRDLVSMQGLGYKEIYAYLDGECSLEEAKDAVKKGTRHFAKRQMTWFRREKEVIWMDKSSFPSDAALLEAMLQILKEKNII